MSTLKKALALLTRKEKRRGGLVLVMVTIMAALETAGVASVVPFLSVLSEPQIVETNTTLNTLYNGFGFPSVDAFIIALGAASFSLILFSALFRSLTYFVLNRYVEMRRHSIGKRLLETYLRQPYGFFLDRHSGDMAKNILSEVDQLVTTVLRPVIHLVTYSIVLLAMVALIVAVNPGLALTVGVLIGGSYIMIFSIMRGILGRIGRDRAKANQARFTAASEALGGIKDIKLLGRESAYLTRFNGPSRRHARHNATNLTIATVPRFLIEAMGFGGVIALVLFLLMAQGGTGGATLSEILPVLGLYIFAAYRLLPAAQQIYASVAKMRFGAAAVDGVYDDLYQRDNLALLPKFSPEPLQPKQALKFSNVTYTYPNAGRVALAGVDFEIAVGSSLGIVGATGAGKTTLIDLLLGLLAPTLGEIQVDGVPIKEGNLRSWQRAVGYVPQDIFLTDTSVRENIALGVPPGQIDDTQVETCARMAQVHDFIVKELPQKYDTLVGERGVRLSGGQRQRIGIARALYHNPQVLVFDEATSALDTVTERAVMKAVDSLQGAKTLIMIAHRLSTVRNCDLILMLEGGQVKAKGAFADLSKEVEGFNALASM